MNETHQQQIIDALTQLEGKGLPPTVARLKGLLPNSVSMPEIIQGIQQWKSGAIINTQPVKEKALSMAERIEMLEQQVNTLIA